MHISWIMLRKQGALNNQMLRLGCCLPPIKIPGYVPGYVQRKCLSQKLCHVTIFVMAAH